MPTAIANSHRNPLHQHAYLHPPCNAHTELIPLVTMYNKAHYFNIAIIYKERGREGGREGMGAIKNHSYLTKSLINTHHFGFMYNTHTHTHIHTNSHTHTHSHTHKLTHTSYIHVLKTVHLH